MADQSTTSLLANHFVKAVSPLENIFSDEKLFINQLSRLGWKVTSLPDEYKQLADNIRTIRGRSEAVLANPGVTEVSALITEIVQFINALKAIDNLPAGIAAPDKAVFLQALKQLFTDLFVRDYLPAAFPNLYNIAYLLGVIETSIQDAGANRSAFHDVKLRLNRIPEVIKDPMKIPRFVYGWNTMDFDFDLLVRHLDELLSSFGFNAFIMSDDGVALRSLLPDARQASQYKLSLPIDLGYINDAPVQLFIELIKWPSVDGALPGMALVIRMPTGTLKSFDFAPDLSLSLITESSTDISVAAVILPESLHVVTPSASDILPFQNKTGTSLNFSPATPMLLLGSADGSRLDIKGIKLDLEVSNADGMEVRTRVKLDNLSYFLNVSSGDNFISKITRGKPVEGTFSLELIWSNRTGINFSTDGQITFNIPSHIELGPVKLESFNLGLKPSGESLTAFAAANLRTQIGGVTAIIQNIGVSAAFTFPEDNSGNLGPLNIDIGFKSPDGVGLVVDTGGITGGGFLKFDPANKEYFGALELEFRDMFSLKAFGIINTRMPDGSKNFSLLIVITAEFTPVQLGFGFTLNGVGGLLGLNRTAKVDVLKEGIRTNTLSSILFPQDVIANINRIVSDIKQVFPPQNGHFLICPMGKIGWGSPTIITIDLGILIEIPASGFRILGVLKALLPEEKEPLLRLQVNFLGIIDFENKSISFDASLYDSRILTFTLTGDMAFRMSFGDSPSLLLSVGGFHPAFKEVPADLQSMRRITINLYDGSNARINVQTYFAVTSNTAQFGARAELFAGSEGGWNIYGFASYDVLFQFSPFKFIAGLEAGVSLRRGSSVIMGIRVSGELTGPTPWNAKGKASVSFFFFSVSVPFNVTWGNAAGAADQEKADLMVLLTGEINDNRNWKANIPASNRLHVSIKSITQTGDLLVIHPFGILSFSQRLVPLEIEINKFGNKLPKDVNKFEIITPDETLFSERVREQFAAANFLEMKDEDKLSRPSFEKMVSGFKITGSSELKAPENVLSKAVNYEFSYLGRKKKPVKDKYRYPALLFKAHTKTSAAAQSPLSRLSNGNSLNAPQPVTVDEERFVIANVSDMKPYSTAVSAASYTEALQQCNELVRTNPGLKDQVQVLSQYELNTN